MKTQIILLSLMQFSLGFAGYKALPDSKVLSSSIVQTYNPEIIVGEFLGGSIIGGNVFTVTETCLGKELVSKKLFIVKEPDTLKNSSPYKVIKCAPSLKYTIQKVGDGNKVLFSVNNGLKQLPKLYFTQTSGTTFTVQKKEGFDNVIFPFKCTINCQIDYTNNSFSNLASLINDFEVEINEPGYWEISFTF